jgi:hypothetical protein
MVEHEQPAGSKPRAAERVLALNPLEDRRLRAHFHHRITSLWCSGSDEQRWLRDKIEEKKKKKELLR